MSAGRVGRPHGLDGSFYVTGPRPRLLAVGTRLTIGEWATEVIRRRGTDRRPIVSVQGIEDRAGAEAMRGRQLTVQAADAPRLQEGEWWASDLEGCQVFDGERHVGVVAKLIELPSCEALQVIPPAAGGPAGESGSLSAGESGSLSAGESGSLSAGEPADATPPAAELLVPMVRDAIRSVDLAARRIEVDMSFLEEG
jgi:16S rRNA processing protein RimM